MDTENIQDEIRIVAHFISEKVANEKLDYELKKNALMKKVENIINRMVGLEKGWKDSIGYLQESKHKSTQLIMAESRLEGLSIAKKLMQDEFGLNT